MTYVVTEDCIRCKYTDCVTVCPVNCFYEGENMLVIHPEECIDCGLCEVECAASAILPEHHPKAPRWADLNRKYAELWPVITRKIAQAEDAQDWQGVPGKFELHFSPKPAAR